MLVHAGLCRGLPTSGASGGPSHFPLARGSPLPGRWCCLAACKPDPGVQGKMDRNAPLGEDLAFLWSMPARSASPVPLFLSLPAPPLT